MAQAYGDLAPSVATRIGDARLRSGLSERLMAEERAWCALRSGTAWDGRAPLQMNGGERTKVTRDSTPIAPADRIITASVTGKSGVITRRAYGDDDVTAALRRSRR